MAGNITIMTSADAKYSGSIIRIHQTALKYGSGNATNIQQAIDPYGGKYYVLQKMRKAHFR